MYDRIKKERSGRSEEIFHTREADLRGKKEELTGWEFNGPERHRPREILRLENSYGTIAVGSGPERETTILIREKRRHNQPNITNREKKLQESRQIQRPISGGRVFSNNGGSGSGATAFQYGRSVTARGMLGRIRDYARKHEQETIAQMTPFGSSRWDRESSLRQRQEKEQLERKLLQKLCSALEKAETEKKAFSEERERGMVWKWPFPSPEMAAELPEQKEGAPAEEASDGDLDPGQRAADVEGDRKDEKKGR